MNTNDTIGYDRSGMGESGTTGRVREKAREVKNRAMERGQEQYERGKRRAEGEMHAVARAFRTAADELRSDNHSSAGRWVEMAADRIEDMADGLDRQDLGTLMRQSRDLARRNAGAFLAGAVALGFVASRFLKAEPDHRGDFESDMYGYSDYGYESMDTMESERLSRSTPAVDPTFVTRAEE